MKFGNSRIVFDSPLDGRPYNGTMLKIGDFSSLSQVSIKTLRYYDERGLLSPAHVDPQTGYRYYSASQLSRLHRILALKDLGFSLEQIAMCLEEQRERGADARHASAAAGRTASARRGGTRSSQQTREPDPAY